MSYHFPCARPYALLTRPSLLLTQSKLPKCLREMPTQSYATQGFAYAEFDMTRSLLKMQRQVFRAAHVCLDVCMSVCMDGCLCVSLSLSLSLCVCLFSLYSVRAASTAKRGPNL